MRKIIILEGKQDAAFVKALAPDVETREIEIQELGGAGKDAIKALKIALTRVKNDALLKPVDKIGILLDLDPADFNEASKLAFVNAAVIDVFGIQLEEVGHFCEIPDIEARLACHFISPNLDVLLKQIAAKSSLRADCLHACLESQTHIKQKEKEKAWPLYYMRWDICDVKERENGAKHVNFSHTYSKGAWNLEAPILEDLKAFLALF